MREISLLLVDDEREFVETLAERLRARSLHVQIATDGKAALDKLESGFEPDVVVLDLKMPGMDGIEVLKRVKDSNPLVEVVMLTGHATVDTAVDGMKLGAFDYLTKPVDLDVLLNTVIKAVENKNSNEERINTIRTTPYESDAAKNEKIEAILSKARGR